MKVLKFGGTSVGSPASILNLKDIVSRQEDDCIVVVSALGGITDKLITAANEALSPDGDYRTTYEAIVRRHHEMIDAVIAPALRPALLAETDVLLSELSAILLGIRLVRDLSPKSLAAVVSYGERISSRIVTALIPGAVRADSCRFIKTVGDGPYTLAAAETDALIHDTFASRRHLVVCPGFIATDSRSGEITNLGRGGSDYTAAILAAALDASVLEIWTDVDGFMTADPRVIASARTISELSYQEATELCNFGAKVVYPPTIYPVCAKQIPIRILNTMHPDNAGTVISTGVAPGDSAIRGISSIRGVALLTVSGLAMVGVIGVNRRIFSALADAHISVFLVSQASSENSTSLGIQEKDCDRAEEVLNREFADEIAVGKLNPMTVVKGLAAVSLVGEKMRRSSATAGRLFSVLSRESVRVIAFAQGALGMNISFVVPDADLRRAMAVLHDAFFYGDRRVLRLFVAGVGTVGGALLRQIAAQQPVLAERERLDLRVAGVANSRHALYAADGLDLSAWRELLDAALAGDAVSLAETALAAALPGSVFVDCTASPAVAALYTRLLSSGISVVAANKLAASAELPVDTSVPDELDASSLQSHPCPVWGKGQGLGASSLAGNSRFLNEANVGAGLPILSTIRNMVLTGDRITSVEAVLSGTLNFVCNRLALGDALSAAVQLAREKGYTEPDPRIDLSGEDVRRKLVILARTAGYCLNPQDVRLEPFVPVDPSPSVDAFLEGLSSADSAFARLCPAGSQSRYVASFSVADDGRLSASVSLREVSPDSPFYRLDDAENSIVIRSERYTLPLVIRGFGAGAEVTAAGVFADILSLAK